MLVATNCVRLAQAFDYNQPHLNQYDLLTCFIQWHLKTHNFLLNFCFIHIFYNEEITPRN